MWNTPSLQLLPGPPWPGVLAPDRVLSMDKIEMFVIRTVCEQMTFAILNC